MSADAPGRCLPAHHGYFGRLDLAVRPIAFVPESRRPRPASEINAHFLDLRRDHRRTVIRFLFRARHRVVNITPGFACPRRLHSSKWRHQGRHFCPGRGAHYLSFATYLRLNACIWTQDCLSLIAANIPVVVTTMVDIVGDADQARAARMTPFSTGFWYHETEADETCRRRVRLRRWTRQRMTWNCRIRRAAKVLGIRTSSQTASRS
jgi:hypothetical protein